MGGRSLERNSLALTVSALVTGVVGLVYWVAVAKVYPAREVGAAAAIVTTATMLSAFGNLSIGAVFERFLPAAGRRARAMAGSGFAVGATFGLLLGGGFLLLGPTEEMFGSVAEMAVFPLIVVVFSVFALSDHTSVGLREAGWAASKNVAHSLIKLAAVLLFAFTASRIAIVLTWTVPAAIGAGILGWVIVRRFASPEYADASPALPPRREIFHYLGSAYGIQVVGSLAPLMLPLLVVSTLGADSNAYFSIAWSLVTAVLVLMTMLMGPYVAAAAAAPERTYALTVRFVRVLAPVCAAAVVLLAVVAPIVLAVVGDRYAQEGTPLLRLCAIALPLALVGFVYNAVARVLRRLTLAIVVQVANAAVILGVSFTLVADHGLAAMGWAYILAETVSAVVLTVPLVRAIRTLKARAAHSPVS